MSPSMEQIEAAIRVLENCVTSDLEMFLMSYLRANIDDIFFMLMMDYEDDEDLALEEPTVGPYYAVQEDK